MSTFTLDGIDVPFQPGDTVLEAAVRAGHAVPHLCWHEGYPPHGSCRLCLVQLNGRTVTACTTPAAEGLAVRLHDEALQADRRSLLQMLFVEGNHFCPSCEKSGHCRLQAEARAAGVDGPHFEHFDPDRPLDASHPDLLLDFNRCILCGLCVRAGERAGRPVFALGGHGIGTQLLVDSPSGRLADSAVRPDDEAVRVCPVGVILRKRVGFRVPLGERPLDLE